MSEMKHEFGNGIVVTVSENKGVYVINFDPGNVDFDENKVPPKYAGCGIGSNRQAGAEYENIPCIYLDKCRGNWWVNFYGFGSTGCSDGERWTFPKYTNKGEADKFVKAIGIVIDKLVKVGYIKDDLIKTHELAGNVKIVVESIPDSDKLKVTIDRGNVDFTLGNMPNGWGHSRYVESGKKYAGSPIIHNARCELTSNDFYISEWDGKFSYIQNGGIFTRTDVEKILNSFKLVIAKLVEVGYIKDEVLGDVNSRHLDDEIIGEHKFGDVTAIVTKEKDEYLLNINGLKTKAEYPSEYYTGYPSVYAHWYNKTHYNIRGSDGKWLTSDGDNWDSEWEIYNTQVKSKETIKLMLKTIEESVKRLNEIMEKDAMDQRRNAEYKFGKITIKFTPVCGSDDEVTMNITGMEDVDDLPEEYMEDSPRCYYDYSDESFVVNTEDDRYIECDGNLDRFETWLYTDENEDCKDELKIDVAEMIVKEIEKCVNRLRAMTGKKEEKTMTEECVFNGLGEYQNCVVYDFSGCKITVKKTDDVDKFEININPGPFDFDMYKGYFYKDDTYGKLNVRIELENGSHDNTKFWVNAYVDGSYFFKNGDKMTKAGINTVLKHVKGGVDYFVGKEKAGTPVKVVDLMTSAKMEAMLASGSLPSEVSLEKWKAIREYVVVNKCSNFSGIKEGGWTTCALCHEYSRDSCATCPLNAIGQKCSNYSSIYSSILDYKLSSGTNAELLQRIDLMISVLERCVEKEKDDCKVMTRDEMLDLLDDEDYTPAEISLQAWESKLKYVKIHKNVIKAIDIQNWGSRNCSLCEKFDYDCSECPISKIDKKEECREYGSTFNKVLKYSDGNHDEFVKLVEAEVELLKKVVEFEKTPVVKYDIELQTSRKVFDFSGVKVAIKPVGEKFKISIDSNGYDLSGKGYYGKNIELPDGKTFEIRFHVDQMERHDWYIGDMSMRRTLPMEDQCKFKDGEFDNGIELSKEGTLMLATILSRYLKVLKDEGKLKRCEN